MLPSFATQAATVVRPARVKDHGNWIPDYDNPVTSFTVTGCSIQPSSGSRDNQHREAVLTSHSLWMPAGTDLRARDRITIGGTRYDVVDVQVWDSVLPHVFAAVNVWEG